MTEQWLAKKLEVLVNVPEELDLEWLRGRGPQPDEQLQPEEQPSSSQAASLDTLAAAAAGQPQELLAAALSFPLAVPHFHSDWQCHSVILICTFAKLRLLTAHQAVL